MIAQAGWLVFALMGMRASSKCARGNLAEATAKFFEVLPQLLRVLELRGRCTPPHAPRTNMSQTGRKSAPSLPSMCKGYYMMRTKTQHGW